MSVRGAGRWLTALFVLLALFGAACSSDDDDGGGGGGLGPAGQGGQQNGGDGEDDEDDGGALGGGEKRDGCELVTQADAEELLLEPVTEDTESEGNPFAFASCFWEVDRETSFKLLQFNAVQGEQFYGEEEFGGDDNVDFEKVDGLGDRAFFYSLGGGMPSLQVLEGDTVIFLDVSQFNIEENALDPATAKDQLVALAKKVLARL